MNDYKDKWHWYCGDVSRYFETREMAIKDAIAHFTTEEDLFEAEKVYMQRVRLVDPIEDTVIGDFDEFKELLLDEMEEVHGFDRNNVSISSTPEATAEYTRWIALFTRKYITIANEYRGIDGLEDEDITEEVRRGLDTN